MRDLPPQISNHTSTLSLRFRYLRYQLTSRIVSDDVCVDAAVHTGWRPQLWKEMLV